LKLEVGELNDVVGRLSVADASVAAKYDDPYEENPVTDKCLCKNTEQRSAEVSATDVVGAVTCDSATPAGSSTEQQMSSRTSDYLIPFARPSMHFLGM